jgi:putative transposase
VARTDAGHLRTAFSMSERHACGLAGIAVSSYRYASRRRAGDTGLSERLKELAQEHPRYGYRRLCVLVRRSGTAANHKRVHRLYREAGLSLRRKKRKRLMRLKCVFPRATGSNEEWALDFVTDSLASQRHLRVLSVVDVFTRECLTLETDTSLGSVRVIRALEQVIGERGEAPQRIRTDNGPEFTSRCFIAWCLDRRIELVHIRPGKPVENAHVESFHGRLREECLQVNWFRNLFDARRQIETWRVHYNTARPHSSLGYRTPTEFAALRAAGKVSAGAGQGISNADPLPHTPIPAQPGDQIVESCRMLE